MRVTWDEGASAGYIYLVDKIESGEAKRTLVVADEENLILDFDKDGRLLGIEILDRRLMRPELIAIAEQIDTR